MRTKTIVITMIFVLVLSLGSFVLAEVNNQNTNEEVNTNTQYSQFRECDAECDGEQLQRRMQRQEFRSLQLEKGNNGEARQQQKQLRKNRFGFESK